MSRKMTFMLGCLLLMSLLQGQETGQIYFSDDDGVHWRRADTGLPATALVNDFVVFRQAYLVATDNHGIYRSDDQGKTWRPVGVGMLPSRKINALATNGGVIFAGTFAKGVFLSIDGGAAWLPANKGLELQDNIYSLDIHEGVVYASAADGLYAFDVATRTWRRLTEKVQANQPAFIRNMIYVANNKGVLLSDDRGKTWKQIYTAGAIRSIVAHGSDVYASDFNLGLFKASEQGRAWLPVANIHTPGSEEAPSTTTMLSLGNSLLASGLTGLFISYTNGLTWEKIEAKTPPFKKIMRVDGRTLVALAGGSGGGC